VRAKEIVKPGFYWMIRGKWKPEVVEIANDFGKGLDSFEVRMCGSDRTEYLKDEDIETEFFGPIEFNK